jgi:hypothetical protein
MIMLFGVFLFSPFVRPTGWHGESGSAISGGHLTVRFLRRDGGFGSTQHVYSCDEAYRESIFSVSIHLTEVFRSV